MVVFLCGGCDCIWWWLYVVVEAVHGCDGHIYTVVAKSFRSSIRFLFLIVHTVQTVMYNN